MPFLLGLRQPPPTAPSGGIETDQSMEFNPNNKSYHPVVAEIKSNSYTTPTATNGNIETMEAPWDNGRARYHVLFRLPRQRGGQRAERASRVSEPLHPIRLPQVRRRTRSA